MFPLFLFAEPNVIVVMSIESLRRNIETYDIGEYTAYDGTGRVIALYAHRNEVRTKETDRMALGELRHLAEVCLREHGVSFDPAQSLEICKARFLKE